MNKKSFLFIFVTFLAFFASAQEKNEFSKGLNVDFTYHPHASYVSGKSHYAPLTGIYESVEFRIIGNVDYKIPTPLGEHWLLKDSYFMMQANCELTPVTIKPGIHFEFCPLPFLVFSAGAQIGTGWDFIGITGIGKYNGVDSYSSYKPFEALFLKWYLQGTFQFDTGAIWKGEWSHIQLMYTYQVYYEGLSNVENGDLWMWQGGGNKANGLCNYQSLILAYQMPLLVSRVGFLFEYEGHYNDSDYSKNSNYKGDFVSLSIGPMCQLSFTQNDVLTLVLHFKSRRSFVENHTKEVEEPNLTYDGREWFFNRIIFSYRHNF